MQEEAEKAEHKKTIQEAQSNDQTAPPVDNGVEDATTPDYNAEKYRAYALKVKDREFKIANVELEIGTIKNHPATRIVFDDPYIEWLVYFLNGEYHNVLRDKSGDIIITNVKSKYPPWNEDKQRDKKILSAFALKGWKRGDIHLLFKAVESAYFNHKDLNTHLYLPQLQIMQTDDENWNKYDNTVTQFEYAEILMKDYHFISNNGNEVYIYQNGVYLLDENGDFIRNSYREMAQENYTVLAANSVLTQIITENRTRPEAINPDRYIINFLNGLYDLRTGELSKHTPDHISTVQIPHAYNPNAKPSKTINNIIAGILKPEDIETFKEYDGYSLSLLNDIKKSGFVVGEPDTGKTVLIEILLNMIGKKNIFKVSLESISKDRFEGYNLKDKLLCYDDDIGSNTIYKPETLKTLTGGSDLMRGEKKGQQTILFKSTSKLLYGGNQLPDNFQHSDMAWFKRWILFECTNVHSDDDPNTKKLKEIIDSISEEEYSAFIKECLDAFREVLNRGHFTLSQSNKDIKRTYLILSNPLAVFIDECTKPDSFEVKTTFLNAYNRWAEKNNAEILIPETMGKKMKGKGGLGYGDKKETLSQGVRLYTWEEITLTEEARKEFVF